MEETIAIRVMKGRRVGLIAVLPMVLLPPLLFGHPALDEQIARLTKRIAEDPSDEELYVQRARLHRRHEGLEAAGRDLKVAEALNPKLPQIGLEWGLLFLAGGDFDKARRRLDPFLAEHPDHLRARRVRGQALANLGVTPMVSGIDLSSPFTADEPSFFNFVWSGAEAPGSYTMFFAAVVPGAFADGTVKEGDILSLATVNLTFEP